ncbi:MAG: hypothetical protein CVU90_03620 [Firmicutes bacterium HGW-Firmicutes-15]|nr:MAG: hypothetical protein CVU90_03620 [Firmicutes bacterium HGW-Firmicutes-15]
MRITYRAIVKEFNSKQFSQKQVALKRECRRYDASLNEFSDKLEQIDFQIRFLAGLIYRMAHDSNIKTGNSIRILRTPDEMADYLYKQDADCVMLTSPEHMPVVLKRKEIGWVKDWDEFADWLMVHWESEILVIAVS